MSTSFGSRLAAIAAGLVAVVPGFGEIVRAAPPSPLLGMGRRQYRVWHLWPKGWNAPRARYTGARPAGFDVLTRQISRHQDRREHKRVRTNTVRFVRAARARSLNERQARREKSGFYSGAVAMAYALGNRCGRLRRQRKDDTGKWSSRNLVRWA